MWGGGLASEKELLQIAEKRRELEIKLLWDRSVFFGTFAVAGFAGYAYFFNQFNFIFALLIAGFGFIASLIWTLANRGSKYWQENWEVKSDKLQKGYFKKLEEAQKKGFWSGVRFSPSRLTIALSDYLTFAWFIIIFATLFIVLCGFPHYRIIQLFSVLAVIFTIAYAVWVYFDTKHFPQQS